MLTTTMATTTTTTTTTTKRRRLDNKDAAVATTPLSAMTASGLAFSRLPTDLLCAIGEFCSPQELAAVDATCNDLAVNMTQALRGRWKAQVQAYELFHTTKTDAARAKLPRPPLASAVANACMMLRELPEHPALWVFQFIKDAMLDTRLWQRMAETFELRWIERMSVWFLRDGRDRQHPSDRYTTFWERVIETAFGPNDLAAKIVIGWRAAMRLTERMSRVRLSSDEPIPDWHMKLCLTRALRHIWFAGTEGAATTEAAALPPPRQCQADAFTYDEDTRRAALNAMKRLSFLTDGSQAIRATMTDEKHIYTCTRTVCGVCQNAFAMHAPQSPHPDLGMLRALPTAAAATTAMEKEHNLPKGAMQRRPVFSFPQPLRVHDDVSLEIARCIESELSAFHHHMACSQGYGTSSAHFISICRKRCPCSKTCGTAAAATSQRRVIMS